MSDLSLSDTDTGYNVEITPEVMHWATAPECNTAFRSTCSAPK